MKELNKIINSNDNRQLKVIKDEEGSKEET